MASDIKLIGDNVIIEGSVCVGTSSPRCSLHVENSAIHSGGNAGGFSFQDRTQSGQTWVWYATGGKARLWIGNDVLSIDPTGLLDITVGRFDNCYVRNHLSGSYLGRSQLLIRNEGVVLQNPNVKGSVGVALAHTDKNELSLNDKGGYLGGVRITGELTVDGGPLIILSEYVLLNNPKVKVEGFGGIALAHTDQNELALNYEGGYLGGVRITGKLTVDGGPVIILSDYVLLNNPKVKVKGIGIALAHTDQNELALNYGGGYSGGVRITGELTVDGGPLIILSEYVLLNNPKVKVKGIGIGIALAHTDKNELALNYGGGYLGGVRITGKLTVDGDVQVNGALSHSSSREVKEGITPFSAREAMQALVGLNPVKFFYKGREKKEQRVGFVAEESPGLVTDPEHRSMAVMDVVAVLTRAVQQQQEVISQLADEVKELRRKCEQLFDQRPPETQDA